VTRDSGGDPEVLGRGMGSSGVSLWREKRSRSALLSRRPKREAEAPVSGGRITEENIKSGFFYCTADATPNQNSGRKDSARVRVLGGRAERWCTRRRGVAKREELRGKKTEETVSPNPAPNFASLTQPRSRRGVVLVGERMNRLPHTAKGVSRGAAKRLIGGVGEAHLLLGEEEQGAAIFQSSLSNRSNGQTGDAGERPEREGKNLLSTSRTLLRKEEGGNRVLLSDPSASIPDETT